MLHCDYRALLWSLFLDALGSLKGISSEDISRLKTENVQIFPFAGVILLFCQYFAIDELFCLESGLLKTQLCWLTLNSAEQDIAGL